MLKERIVLLVDDGEVVDGGCESAGSAGLAFMDLSGVRRVRGSYMAGW